MNIQVKNHIQKFWLMRSGKSFKIALRAKLRIQQLVLIFVVMFRVQLTKKTSLDMVWVKKCFYYRLQQNFSRLLSLKEEWDSHQLKLSSRISFPHSYVKSMLERTSSGWQQYKNRLKPYVININKDFLILKERSYLLPYSFFQRWSILWL
jgi:hypothetical protein